MAFIDFLRSTPGRVLRVVVGFALIAYGGTQGSLFGLILMMVGMVPTVTGVAAICLLEEIVKTREVRSVTRGHPREGRA